VRQVLSEAQLEELTRDDPLLRAFAARDPNAPTTALRRAVEDEDIPSDAPAFNINLGVLGLDWTSAVTDFQEGTPLHTAAGCDPNPNPQPQPQPGVGDFNWTQQLQAADAAARVQLTSALSDAGDAVNATTTPWWAAVGQGLQAVGGGLQTVGGGLQVAGSFVANVTSSTGSAISGATGAIANATAAAASSTGFAISGATGAIANATAAAASGTGSAISGATGAIANATAAAASSTGSAISGATGAIANATAAAASGTGSAISGAGSAISGGAANATAAVTRRRRGNATTSLDSKGQPRIEKIAAELSEGSKDSQDRLAEVGHAGPASRLAEAVVVARGRRRRSNSTLLERVLLSGGSVPPFANGRVVERVANQEATAPAQNVTTVPAGFGEPAAQDPDEWW
jgi:hypothetical protein